MLMEKPSLLQIVKNCCIKEYGSKMENMTQGILLYFEKETLVNPDTS